MCSHPSQQTKFCCTKSSCTLNKQYSSVFFTKCCWGLGEIGRILQQHQQHGKCTVATSNLANSMTVRCPVGQTEGVYMQCALWFNHRTDKTVLVLNRVSHHASSEMASVFGVYSQSHKGLISQSIFYPLPIEV